VCSNLFPVSSSVSSVSTPRFLAGLLSVDLNFVIRLWMSHVLVTVFPGNL
jgi:hypothetical protein